MLSMPPFSPYPRSHVICVIGVPRISTEVISWQHTPLRTLRRKRFVATERLGENTNVKTSASPQTSPDISDNGVQPTVPGESDDRH